MLAWTGPAPKPGQGRKPVAPGRSGLEGAELQHCLPPLEELGRQITLSEARPGQKQPLRCPYLPKQSLHGLGTYIETGLTQVAQLL